MTGLYLNFRVQLGCSAQLSINSELPVTARGGKIKDIRALDWCPGPVVVRL